MSGNEGEWAQSYEGWRMFWFGRYEGWIRWLCHGVKAKDRECIRKAALLFDLMIPDTEDAVVVPMPSHTGLADSMLEVARTMSDFGGRRTYLDALACEPHEPSYWQKKRGHVPTPFQMRVRCELPKDMQVFVIDNCISSGATAAAALKAIPNSRVCVIAKA